MALVFVVVGGGVVGGLIGFQNGLNRLPSFSMLKNLTWPVEYKQQGLYYTVIFVKIGQQ